MFAISSAVAQIYVVLVPDLSIQVYLFQKIFNKPAVMWKREEICRSFTTSTYFYQRGNKVYPFTANLAALLVQTQKYRNDRKEKETFLKSRFKNMHDICL